MATQSATYGALQWALVFNNWEKTKTDEIDGWNTTLVNDNSFLFKFTKTEISSILKKLFSDVVTDSGIIIKKKINAKLEEESEGRIKITFSKEIYDKHILIFLDPIKTDREEEKTQSTN